MNPDAGFWLRSVHLLRANPFAGDLQFHTFGPGELDDLARLGVELQ